MLAMTSNLKSLREEMKPKLAQEDLAHAAGLRATTYRNAEWGKNVSYTTAKRILEALNRLREEQDLSPLSLDDLGISIV